VEFGFGADGAVEEAQGGVGGCKKFRVNGHWLYS
jgi:hypothetical protein